MRRRNLQAAHGEPIVGSLVIGAVSADDSIELNARKKIGIEVRTIDSREKTNMRNAHRQQDWIKKVEIGGGDDLFCLCFGSSEGGE